MKWNFRIWTDGENFWIIEVYYKNKHKFCGYTDFLHIGDSKQSVLNSLKKLYKEKINFWRYEESVKLNNTSHLYSRKELEMVILPNLKKKVLHIDYINKNSAKKI